jgi:erythromycin esterase
MMLASREVPVTLARSHGSRLGALLTLAATLVAGTSPPPDDAADAWLATHAIRLHSLDPADRDFADLAPLKELIGSARMVFLGEQTHGDGATFLGKARLIEFLHREMGFDVLVFESGLFDLAESWKAIKAGTPAREAIELGVFPIWTASRQFEPTVDLVARLAASERPLELAGYDCQLTGRASRERLGPAIRALNADGAPPPLDDPRLAAIDAAIAGVFRPEPSEPATEATAVEAIGTLAVALEGPAFAELPAEERSFWKRMLATLPAAVAVSREGRAAPPAGTALAERFNRRDEVGGATLVWLARERYPDRKLIVWAASMHGLRHHPRLRPVTSGLDYAGVRSAGHVAAESLGDELVVLAFTTGPGTAGTPFRSPWTVPPAPPGSLEARCAALELGPAIIPLRGAADGTFGADTFVARPLGNAPMLGRWRDHLDGFVFTPTSTPSTPRPSDEDRKEFAALLPALERAAAADRERCAKGHPFADKGDWSLIWERWRFVVEPNPQALAAGAAEAIAFGQALGEDPCLGWRGHALRAAILASTGDRKGGIAAYDAALKAYPHRTHRRPAVHSGYHHLANARAMLLWDEESFSAAVAWIAARLSEDEAFRAFHAAPWLERIGADAARRTALRSAVAEAFAERARRRPAEAEAIRAAAADADESLADVTR